MPNLWRLNVTTGKLISFSTTAILINPRFRHQVLENLTCQRFWMKENYDNNKEFKITRFFPSKIYMCSLWSLVFKCFSFLLRLFSYRKSMVSTNKLLNGYYINVLLVVTAFSWLRQFFQFFLQTIVDNTPVKVILHRIWNILQEYFQCKNVTLCAHLKLGRK